MILILTNPKEYEGVKILEEMEKRNLEFEIIPSKDINIFSILDKDIDLLFVHRSGRAFNELKFVARILENRGIRVVDHTLTRFPNFTKSSMYLIARTLNIPFPKTLKLYYLTKESISKLLDLGFPLIAKKELEHRGRGVILIQNKTQLQDFLKKYGKSIHRFVFQEFINYKSDLRTIIVGNKILGTIKRIPSKDFRANISLGGTAIKVKTPKLIKEMIYKLKSFLNFDMAALDFLYDGKNYYFLEIHTRFQFRGFEKATKINVAEEIVKYIESLISK